jgi:hypothetical protein
MVAIAMGIRRQQQQRGCRQPIIHGAVAPNLQL